MLGEEHSARSVRRKKPVRARLGIEVLEDRSLLSAVRLLAGFEANTLPANDDYSTGPVSLGFTANFFGNQYSSLYVNNNGNVTFDGPLSAFVPFDLPSASIDIIAPFFADVDTTDPSPGVVTYGQDTVEGRSAFGVNWINVGYFNQHTDKLNSFQVVLIDRSDVAAGAFDIEFNYDQVQWETGGSGGLGGTSARAGYTHGSELAGSGVNGAFLDDNTSTGLIHFSSNSTVPGRYRFEVRLPNQPPVLDPIGDQSVDEGQELTFTATASDPDVPTNTLTFSLVGDVPQGASIDSTWGVFAWTPTNEQGFGSYTFTVRVADEGNPSLFDEETITVIVNEVLIRIWDGGASDNLWSSPENWSGDALPEAGDTVIFDGTSTKNAVVDSFYAGTIDQLQINGGYTGTISLDRDLTVTSYLLQESGTLDGSGSLFVEGDFDWLGGTQAGAGMTRVGSGGALTIAGEGEKWLDGRSLVNAGMATWSGGAVFTSNAASFVNEAGASFDIQADTFWGDYYGLGNASTFMNGGLITKTVGTGTATLLMIFENNGGLHVQDGTLELVKGGASTGTFTVASNTTLAFSGGVYTAEAGSSFLGEGLVAVRAPAPAPEAELVAAPNVLVIFGSNLELAANGVIDGPGTFQVFNEFYWTGGTMKGAGITHLAATSQTFISGPNAKTLDGRTLDNEGVLAWDSGDITVLNGAVIMNRPFASLEIRGDNVSILAGAGVESFFKNEGTLTKQTPVGAEGVSRFQLTLENHAVLAISSEKATIESTRFKLVAGELTGEGKLTITSNMLWTGGAMTDPVAAGKGGTIINQGATLAIEGTTDLHIVDRQLINNGLATWLAGNLELRGRAVLANQGTFEVPAISNLQVTSDGFLTAQLNNNGLLVKAGTETATLSIRGVLFANNGNVRVDSGAFLLATMGSYRGSFTAALGTNVVL